MNFSEFRMCVFNPNIVTYHDMNQATLIERIEEAKMALERPLTLLKSAPPECDRFASHLYQSRRNTDRHAKPQEIWQTDRVLCHLDIPGCREAGLQGRHSPMAGTSADWRLRISAVLIRNIFGLQKS
jgi:hypothetical protein